jgi:hypothetical protein
LQYRHEAGDGQVRGVRLDNFETPGAKLISRLEPELERFDPEIPF